MMGEENVESYFSGKSNEEIIFMFLHEIRAPLASAVGYLTMLNLAELSEDKTKEFINLALKNVLKVHGHANKVSDYLIAQRDDS